MLSFHATKTITTGEGGAVVVKSDEQQERVQLWRSHGIQNEPYLHRVPGMNFRLPSVNAAIGLHQLESIELAIELKQEAHRIYQKTLDKKNLYALQENLRLDRFVPWGMPVRIFKNRIVRDEIISKLEIEGIQCRKGFYDNSSLSYFKDRTLYTNALLLSDTIIVLPIYPQLRNEDIEFIVERFHAALSKTS